MLDAAFLEKNKMRANMASGKFSIDDAFESDEEDPIRVYGSTTESAPLRSKRRSDDQKETQEYSREPGDVLVTLSKLYQSGRDEYMPILGEPQAQNTPESMQSVDPKQVLIQDNSDRTRCDSHSISNQSDSYSVSTKTFSEKAHWWSHPKVRENWKIVVASFLLLIVGLGLIAAGIVIEVSGSTAVQSYVFFIAGAICLIPGAYHVVYIYCAVKGKHGFSFYNFPVFR